MPAVRLPASLFQAHRFAIVGVFLGKDTAVRHVGLLSDSVELSGATQVEIFHQDPPLQIGQPGASPARIRASRRRASMLTRCSRSPTRARVLVGRRTVVTTVKKAKAPMKTEIAVQLAQKIDGHLKRIEGDPALNPGYRYDKESKERVLDSRGVCAYYGAHAVGDTTAPRRWRAYEAELLRTLVTWLPGWKPNAYQDETIATYPDGLDTAGVELYAYKSYAPPWGAA